MGLRGCLLSGGLRIKNLVYYKGNAVEYYKVLKHTEQFFTLMERESPNVNKGMDTDNELDEQENL